MWSEALSANERVLQELPGGRASLRNRVVAVDCFPRARATTHYTPVFTLQEATIAKNHTNAGSKL